MKNKVTTKNIIAIIAVIVIGLGAWYFSDKYYINKTVKPQSKQANTDILETLKVEDKSAETTQTLIYTDINDNIRSINKDNLKKEKTTLFTDADENDKIIKFGGYASLSQEVLIFTGNSTVGKLEIVKLKDENKKETLIETFGKPQDLTVSPDGGKIAMTYFSNAEEDYGYGLYEMARDGSNRRKLTTSQDEIKSLVWDSSNKEIYFIKVDKSGKTEIAAVSSDTGKVRTVYASDKNILSLSYCDGGNIVFSISNDSQFTSGQILMVSTDGGTTKKILETEKGVPLYPILSNDKLAVGYVLADLKEAPKVDTMGDVYIKNILANDAQKITGGNLILGWIN